MFLVKRLVFLILIAVFVAAPLGGNALAAQDASGQGGPDGAAMAADIFFARPAGLVAMAFGSVTFVVSLPFSALGHNVDAATQKLVVAPYRYTFDRPLGVFD